jgi:hypothetical protein
MVLPNDLIYYDGRLKYYKKGTKYYAPFVHVAGVSHPLRKHFRTATEAITYGEKVVRRYRQLLSISTVAVA